MAQPEIAVSVASVGASPVPSLAADTAAWLDDETSLALVRPALELILQVALAGTRTRPPIEAPKLLHAVIGHAKVTSRGLRLALRAGDVDEGLRRRAAVLAREHPEVVGRAGMLWLTREPGWMEALEAVRIEAAAAASEGRVDRDERRAARVLAQAETATRRAEARLAVTEKRVRALEEELAETRAERRKAVDDRRLAASRAGKAEADLLAAQEQLSQAIEAEQAANVVEPRRDVVASEAPISSADQAVASVTPPDGAPGMRELDLDELGRNLAAAAHGAAQVARALAAAARVLNGAASAPLLAPHQVAPRTGHRAKSAAGPPLARRPARLPPLVLDDSVEAIEHLVGLAGATLLVDGYNIAMSGWPADTAAGQRDRLAHALAGLAARTGVRVEVVFDGADVARGLGGAPPVAGVDVAFSPPDVEADDVILARVRVAALPIVVASDDRRVRDGARMGGANLATAHQLLELLRRRPG